METLHNIVFPHLNLPQEESLYVRLEGAAHCDLTRQRVLFEKGGELTTDTFYGGLTVSLWRRTCPVKRLSLSLRGSGRFIVGLGLRRVGHACRWLDQRVVDLEEGAPVSMPVASWGSLSDGLLFLHVRALSDGFVSEGSFQTDDPHAREVRLGIVVTHFNRPSYVLPAIDRIAREVIAAPQARGCLRLLVVDNSCSLPPIDRPGVAILRNVNFGGAGGFARGLLELDDDGRSTHCLFMDDDASCEAESILRTLAMLRYAKSPKLAVAGALVNEAEPWQLLEKGARFDGKCQALHAGRDVRAVDQVLWAERERMAPDYGGWWFFAFPLVGLTHYPFPFFVRGDDVFFSLFNRFEIATANGIACLAEPFHVKHGPLTAYLDARYHLVHLVLRPQGRVRALRRLFTNHFLKPLYGYHYASARAFVLALRHVAEGPRFFRDNLDLAEVRALIGSWLPAEKMQPLQPPPLRVRTPRGKREYPLRRVWRALTLGGFLLPRPLLRNRVLVHDKAFYGKAQDVFRFRAVLYEHWPTNTGYLAVRDTRQFFRELRECVAALRLFVPRMKRLHEDYRSGVEDLASRDFWRALYGKTGPGETERSEERRLSA